jgi:hypothetical protein
MATFFMEPFDHPLLVTFSPDNQPSLQPFEHDGSLTQRRGTSISFHNTSFSIESQNWLAGG